MSERSDWSVSFPSAHGLSAIFDHRNVITITEVTNTPGLRGEPMQMGNENSARLWSDESLDLGD